MNFGVADLTSDSCGLDQGTGPYMCFAILAVFWSETGLGSARNGFLAKNYVGYANSQPKRLSGRPFRGQNVFRYVFGRNQAPGVP